MKKRESAEAPQASTFPITVNLRNGSSIDVPSVGAMNDGGATKRRADLMFDKILDLDQVKSVTVGGVEIPMP